MGTEQLTVTATSYRFFLCHDFVFIYMTKRYKSVSIVQIFCMHTKLGSPEDIIDRILPWKVLKQLLFWFIFTKTNLPLKPGRYLPSLYRYLVN